MPGQQNRQIVIGRVAAPQGVRGEVRVVVLTDFPQRFDAGRKIRIDLPDGSRRECVIQTSRKHREGVAIKLEGMDDRTAAEEIRGSQVVINDDDLLDLPRGEFYVFHILGLKVVTVDGREVGRVEEVVKSGANDVYVTDTGICIPALKDVVANVDVAGGVLTIRPVPGLLPDEEDE